MRSLIISLSICLLSLSEVRAQDSYSFEPENPVTAPWIQQHLTNRSTRLMLTPELEEQLKSGIREDVLMRTYFDFLQQNADAILELSLLERRQIGRRLLSVSREAIRRMGTLALVYRLTGESQYAERLEEEIKAVCQFSDWNPSHFLDVAEMAYAVAIGIDWGREGISAETIQLAKQSLKEKALQASFPNEEHGWINSEHNWNQVCHGGLTAAAIMVADEEPELAAQVISRALEKLPLALEAYYPDGAYPEGASYWFYATYYTAMTISVLESALGTDFNLTQSPGFLESALFSMIVAAPSGDYYDYFDASAHGAYSMEHYGILAWFDQRNEQRTYLDRKAYLTQVEKALAEKQECQRFAHAALVWLAELDQEEEAEPLPTQWVAKGYNPLAVLRASPESSHAFFLGTKGGMASLNHGNMDAGSFIFELDSVRWSIDPGNQSYNELEQVMGMELWSREQEGRRWELLTKNNFGHSTLTVNRKPHSVQGFASLASPQSGVVTVDLSEVFGEDVAEAIRTFTKVDEQTLRIEDVITTNNATEQISWALMTTAEVSPTEEGWMLRQDGKQLKVEIVSPAEVEKEVVSLSPPPLEYDKDIENLKRLEVQVDPTTFANGRGKIVVELSGSTDH